MGMGRAQGARLQCEHSLGDACSTCTAIQRGCTMAVSTLTWTNQADISPMPSKAGHWSTIRLSFDPPLCQPVSSVIEHRQVSQSALGGIRRRIVSRSRLRSKLGCRVPRNLCKSLCTLLFAAETTGALTKSAGANVPTPGPIASSATTQATASAKLRQRRLRMLWGCL